MPHTKNQTANSLSHSRPISLCNTSYKIITKIIVARIMPFLQQLVGPTQSGFLQNRRAADNAIIVQEILDHFKRTKGKKGLMLLKLDLEKAFDRIEWSFIYQALNFFNFSKPLIKLIMSCVSSSSISILINGSPTTYFSPTREIRQSSILIFIHTMFRDVFQKY